jgi:hypothetical protein
MAQPYQLVPNPLGGEPNTVLRVATGEFIPFDPANKDYQDYLEWVEAGNQADPPPEPIGVTDAT